MSSLAHALPPPEPQPALRTERILALDGARGLALLLALIVHVAALFAPASRLDSLVLRLACLGWSGVDLFFVLSGYLITTQILERRERPHFLRSFFVRRALRIIPAYYAFLLLVLVVVPRVVPELPPDYRWVLERQLWLWLPAMNLLTVATGQFIPYFAPLWSLSIEEQFYFVWPMAGRRLKVETLKKICLGLVVASFVLRLVLLWRGVSPTVIFAFTGCRLESLSLGALLGLHLRVPSPGLARLFRAGPWVGGLVLVAIFAGTRSFSFLDPWVLTAGYSAAALIFGGLVFRLVGTESPRCSRACESAALRTLGRYSYAIYLVHWPLCLLLRPHLVGSGLLPGLVTASVLPGVLVFLAVVILLSGAVAWLSWHLLEKRFLAYNVRFR